MDRVQLPNQTSSPNFIGAWNLSDASVCDAMIEFFNSESAQKKVGEIGSGIQTELKKSVDITIEPRLLKKAEYSPFTNYLKQLNECYELYKIEWPFLTGFLDTVHVGTFNVQRYLKGDHFKAVHAERMSLANSHRLLAWMTYLNDVDDGGETVFTHYGVSVKPKRGLTLIWPAEWTHAHFGDVLKAGEKYIVTGHFHLPPV